MIKRGDVIKHKNSMDVAVQVFYTREHPDTQDIEIEGVWLNQGFVDTMAINIMAKFAIKKDNLTDWLKCTKPLSKCIRYEEWITIQ